MTDDSSFSGIWPWADGDARLRHDLLASRAAICSMPCTRLCTKYTCPLRSSSRRIAWRTSVSSNSPTKVLIGRRSSGGVSIVLRSRTPVRHMCRVRGMGVAVRVSTSTSVRICLMRSLCVTPKRCSSSTISSPRSLNATSLLSRRCVPITRSTCAVRQPAEDRVLLGGRSGSARACRRSPGRRPAGG